MTDPDARSSSRPRRPSFAPVLWGSLALFSVLFVLLTYQLSAAGAPGPRHVLVRKLIERRVVTRIVPTPGPSSVSSAPAVAGPVSEAPPPEAAPVTTGAS